MNRQTRCIAAAVVALALFIAFARAVMLLPHYAESRGPYEQRRAIESVRASHATNLDAFINFDLRGFDTLGEEFIFLVAIAGFSLIFRERRGELAQTTLEPTDGRRPRDHEIEIATASYIYVPIALVYGLYIVIHGQLTPGGGFQGGVALATGVLAIALGLGFSVFERLVSKDGVEAVEAVGALSYIVLGCAMLVVGGVFLRNALPHGQTGSLLSSGTIIALNDGVGIAIVAGFLVLFAEFLKEVIEQT
jgi:multicomponent Na+:H+ antiporter subunit B